MIESLIAAEKECTESVDIAPGKVLRPIGTVWKEWFEPATSTDPPHWIYWEVMNYAQAYRGRRGDTLLFERHEEIKSIDLEEYEEAR